MFMGHVFENLAFFLTSIRERLQKKSTNKGQMKKQASDAKVECVKIT